MPVSIYRIRRPEQENEQVAWLCDDEWSLTPLGDALTVWLRENAAKLPVAEYVANLAFQWRRSASSGGPAFAPETLRQMADLSMSLLFSEYAGFAEDSTEPSG